MMDRLTLLRVRVHASAVEQTCVDEDETVPKIVTRAISSLPKTTGTLPTQPPPGLGTDAEPELGVLAQGSPEESRTESLQQDEAAAEIHTETDVASGGNSHGEIPDDAGGDRLQFAGLGPVPQLKDLSGVWSDSLGNMISVSPTSCTVQLHDPLGHVRELRFVADFSGCLWCGNAALMHVGVASQPTAESWGIPVHLAWRTVDGKISIWDRVQHPSALPAARPAGGSSRGSKAEKGAKKQQRSKFPDVWDAIRSAPTPQGSKRRNRLEKSDQ